MVIEPDELAPGSGLVVAFGDVNIFRENYRDGDNRALVPEIKSHSPACFTWG